MQKLVKLNSDNLYGSGLVISVSVLGKEPECTFCINGEHSGKVIEELKNALIATMINRRECLESDLLRLKSVINDVMLKGEGK